MHRTLVKVKKRMFQQSNFPVEKMEDFADLEDNSETVVISDLANWPPLEKMLLCSTFSKVRKANGHLIGHYFPQQSEVRQFIP